MCSNLVRQDNWTILAPYYYSCITVPKSIFQVTNSLFGLLENIVLSYYYRQVLHCRISQQVRTKPITNRHTHVIYKSIINKVISVSEQLYLGTCARKINGRSLMKHTIRENLFFQR